MKIRQIHFKNHCELIFSKNTKKVFDRCCHDGHMATKLFQNGTKS